MPQRTAPLALLSLLAALAACGGGGAQPLPAPRIDAFQASDGAITAGGATTLVATFSNGTGRVDHGIGAVTSGVPFSTGALAAGATFTLTVTNAEGVAVTATVAVAVHPAATIASFTAAASPVTAGGGTTLTAVFAGGAALVDRGVGEVSSGVAVPTGPLAAGATFTLTVTNPAGDAVTATATVDVVAPPVITAFAPAAAQVLVGGGTELLATFTGGEGVVTPGLGPVTSGVPLATGPLAASATWTLTVTNAAGDAATAEATVAVVAPPAVTSFTSAAPFVRLGTPATLTAVFSGGAGAVDGGVGPVTSGVPFPTGALAGPATFTLTVTGFGGAQATATVAVGTTDCASGTRDGDEEGVDCGGACGPCPADCAAVLAADAAATSGVHDVDPDGAGGAPAFPAYCDMTTGGGGYTLCAAHADGAKGDGLGYLTARWGMGAAPFFDGATVLGHGSFCEGLAFSEIIAAHWTEPTVERFRTGPIPTGGENPFAAPPGRRRYTDAGAGVFGVLTKDAMAQWFLSGAGCNDENNGPPQGTSLCFSDGASWQLMIGNLNNYQYEGEGEWMCAPNAVCGWPSGSESVLIFVR